MSSVGRDEAIVTDSHREQVPKEMAHDINKKTGVQPVMSGVYNTVTDATPSYSTQVKQGIHNAVEKTQAGLHTAKESLQESLNRGQEASTQAANDARPNRGVIGTVADKLEEGAQMVQNRIHEWKTKAADTASEADLAAQHKATQAKDLSQDAADSLYGTTATTTTSTTSTVPSYTTQAKEMLYNAMEKTQQGLHAVKETIQEKLHHGQEAAQETINDSRPKGTVGAVADKMEQAGLKVSNRVNEMSTKAADKADELSQAAKHRSDTVKDYSKDTQSSWQADAALHE